jgi:hypothetical protein
VHIPPRPLLPRLLIVISYSLSSSLNALASGFSLNEEVMTALYPSLKEARIQLRKDVRYLKVMKPKVNENIGNANVTSEDDGATGKAIESIDGNG